MTRNQRFAMLGLAAVVLVVAAVVIGTSGSDDDGSTPSAAPTQTSTAPAGTTTSEEPAEPPAPEVTEIVVKDAKPVGGLQAITVKKGDRVRINVTSDVTDHAHLHGYDISKDVGPGKDARFSFVAKIDGEFELELEEKKEPIAKLVVQP